MPRPRARKSIYIAQDPRDVYDFALGDLQSLPDWMVSVDTVEGADERWPEVGASHTYTRKVTGREIRGTTTILEADPPRRVVMREEVQVEGSPPIPPDRAGRSIWTFEPEGRGCRATMELEGAEVNVLTLALWKLLVGGGTSGRLAQSLANLKRICEQELEDATPE